MAKAQSASFGRPDEVRSFDHGRLEVVSLGEETVGRQVFEPGWRWSVHVKPLAGTPSCEFHHLGYVVSGRLRAEMDDGSILEIGPEEVFEIPAGHDAWVLGHQPCVIIQWSGIRTWGTPLLATGERILTTVLFTDIVGSTDIAARLGDGRWRELLATHNEHVRRALDRHAGAEVKTTGDGFLARFDAPARAVRCARVIRDATAGLGLELRAAVHTGEVEVVGDDIRGVAVHMASRILALADPGDILVSATTRDLVDGSGLTFDERGRHELKGISGAREIFALAGGAPAP
jgi:class 3 adenylate cyclase